MDDLDHKYVDFASKVSFFEFVENEFRPSELPVDSLSSEIEQLQSRNNWDIDSLSRFIQNSPRSFLIFQDMFQLQRFTNAQMIHFMFDISKMNTPNLDSTFEYAILNFMNDLHFQRTFLGMIKRRLGRSVKVDEVLTDRKTYPKAILVAVFKMVIPDYVSRMQKDISLIASRLSKPEFSDCSLRIANYLLDRLELNKMLKSIDLKEYLRNKKIPRDTKGIHGNYLKLRVRKVLDEHGYLNFDAHLNVSGISKLPRDLTNVLPQDLLMKKRIYCTEKAVEGIVKKADRREKKFDLIIVSDGKPKHLFEMNFYTTQGTKIDINENEYLELSKSIRENTDCQFHWITDGNYWLTEQGERKLKNLWAQFGEIYNLNTFEEKLLSFSF
jgi:hypothetical protein